MYKIVFILGFLFLIESTRAEVQLELDGQTLPDVESIVYDSADKRLSVAFSAPLRCFGSGGVPLPNQLSLQFGSQNFLVEDEIVYRLGPGASVLSVNTISGQVNCELDAIHQDRFELAG